MGRFIAFKSTGLYCVPSCGPPPPDEEPLRFELAAAAEAEGFRACAHCAPYRAPVDGYASAPDLVCRAVEMILAGDLDDESEDYVASEVGVSSRHLRRLFLSNLGVTPTQLARSSRAHFARRLLEDTDLTVLEIAMMAGFGSVRQLNRVFREVFHAAPNELRLRTRHQGRPYAADGGLRLELPFDGPFDWDAMVTALAATAIPGVEDVSTRRYARVVTLHGDPGVIELEPLDHRQVLVTAHLPHWEGLIHIVRRSLGILGLNDFHHDARARLADDPLLSPLVAARPGLRVPGTWDPLETAVMAILREKSDYSEATAAAARLVRRYGRQILGLEDLHLTHAFPEAKLLGTADLEGLGISEKQQHAIAALGLAVGAGHIKFDGSADADEVAESMRRAAGASRWVAAEIALRLGSLDAFPVDRHMIGALDGLVSTAHLKEVAENWRPWRSLGASYLRGVSLASRVGNPVPPRIMDEPPLHAAG